MAYLVSKLKTGVSGLLSGINIKNVTDPNGAIERAVRILVQKATVPETEGRQSITLYSGVYDYLAPTTIFGGQFVDLRPQGDSRNLMDFVYKKGTVTFDRTKHTTTNGYTVTFEYRQGIGIMRVSQRKAIPSINLDPMNALTGWVAGGNATGLALDSTVFYNSPSSLRFNLGTGSNGYIEKTLQQSVDITGYNGVAMAFLSVYLPSAAPISSIGVRIGSDANNYFDVSSTKGFLGAFQAGDFLLIALDLSLATTVLAPVITKIKYVRCYINSNGTALPNVRFGGLFLSLPSPHTLIFESTAMFIANTPGALPSQFITNDTDQIIIGDGAYTLLEHEAAITIALSSGSSLAGAKIGTIQALLNGARTKTGTVVTLGLYDIYRGQNPDPAVKEAGNWID